MARELTSQEQYVLKDVLHKLRKYKKDNLFDYDINRSIIKLQGYLEEYEKVKEIIKEESKHYKEGYIIRHDQIAQAARKLGGFFYDFDVMCKEWRDNLDNFGMHFKSDALYAKIILADKSIVTQKVTK